MKEKKGDDIPYDLGITYLDFIENKDEWILWRTLGHYTDNGAWVPPVSFLEAELMPKRKLDAFFALDNLVELMRKQQRRKSKNG